MTNLAGIFVDKFGNIVCRQGDGGSINITGIPVEKDYKVCLALSIPHNGEIVAELSAQSENEDSIEFEIPKEFTDKLEEGKYFYGIKLKDDETEQTVIPNAFMSDDGRITLGNAPCFHVKRKLVKCEE